MTFGSPPQHAWLGGPDKLFAGNLIASLGRVSLPKSQSFCLGAAWPSLWATSGVSAGKLLAHPSTGPRKAPRADHTRHLSHDFVPAPLKPIARSRATFSLLPQRKSPAELTLPCL